MDESLEELPGLPWPHSAIHLELICICIKPRFKTITISKMTLNSLSLIFGSNAKENVGEDGEKTTSEPLCDDGNTASKEIVNSPKGEFVSVLVRGRWTLPQLSTQMMSCPICDSTKVDRYTRFEFRRHVQERHPDAK